MASVSEFLLIGTPVKYFNLTVLTSNIEVFNKCQKQGSSWQRTLKKSVIFL